MGHLFSRPSTSSSNANKLTPHDRALLSLKVSRDKLKQYAIQLATLQARETEIAKQCIAKGERRKAKIALMKRNQQMDMMEKAERQIMSVEEMVGLKIEGQEADKMMACLCGKGDGR